MDRPLVEHGAQPGATIIPACLCLSTWLAPPAMSLQEAFLRHLLQRSKFSAAAAFMTSSLRGAGRLPLATS